MCRDTFRHFGKRTNLVPKICFLTLVFAVCFFSIIGSACNISSISFGFRKLYWTDGNTINMANMDGSNIKILFQNQKEPVGKYFIYN